MQVQGVQHVLNPAAHRGPIDAEVLHRVGEFVLDGVCHEGRIAVLAYITDDISEVAGPVLLGTAPIHCHRTGETAAREVGHEAVHASEQSRLARTGGADDEGEVAFFDGQVDLVKNGLGCARVTDSDPIEADHASVSFSFGRWPASAGDSAEARTEPRMQTSAVVGTAGRPRG